MRSGGGAPVRMSAPGGHVGGAPVAGVARPGMVNRGFVPINRGFVGTGGVRFRGAVGFGHNPRFFVGFGNRFRHGFVPGFGNGCFSTGFCNGFGTFFGGGIPIGAYYPYAYPY